MSRQYRSPQRRRGHLKRRIRLYLIIVGVLLAWYIVEPDPFGLNPVITTIGGWLDATAQASDNDDALILTVVPATRLPPAGSQTATASDIGSIAAEPARTPAAAATLGSIETLMLQASGPRDQRALFLVNPDGSATRRLTTRGDSTEPVWSPDRTRVAYSSTREGRTDIYIMDVTTRAERQITGTSEDGTYNATPTWSPDSQYLAFISNRSGKKDIVVVRLEDGDAKMLSPRDLKAEYDTPAWSPDGKQIAFASNKTGHNEIWLMGSSGINLRQLTITSAGEFTAPAWSPDGTQIAFIGSGDGNSAVFVLNLKTNKRTKPRDLPGYFMGAVAWSPDGAKLAYMLWNEQTPSAIEVVTVADPESVYRIAHAGIEVGYPAWASIAPKEPLQLAVFAESGDAALRMQQSCPDAPAPRLANAKTARISKGVRSLVLRASAGANGKKIALLGAGTTLTLYGEPLCAEGFIWWRVNYGNLVGWVAEGQNHDYWIEPG